MIILTTTSDQIRVNLATAGTAVKLVACWRDITSTTYLPARTVAPSNDTTAVVLVASPAAAHQLKVDFLSAYNADSVGHTVTFEFYDGTNAYPLWIGTLAVGESVQFVEGKGFQKLDSAGNIVQKTAFAATTSSELAGVVSDETGTGALVFANSPALVTPALGTPASGNLVNCTGFPVTLGANTFTGQQQLAASQAATDANSAMSRGLADARSLVSAQGSNLTINNSDTYNATSMTLTLTAGTWELGGFFQTLNAATGGAKIYISVVSGGNPESYNHRFFMMAVNGGSTNPLFSGGTPTYGAGTFPFRFSVAMASGAGSFITIVPTIIVLTATARFDIGFSQNTAVVGDATLYSFSKFWAKRLTH